MEITIMGSAPFEEMDWYREVKDGWNGAVELRANRDKFGYAQKDLGESIESALLTMKSLSEHTEKMASQTDEMKKTLEGFGEIIGDSPIYSPA